MRKEVVKNEKFTYLQIFSLNEVEVPNKIQRNCHNHEDMQERRCYPAQKALTTQNLTSKRSPFNSISLEYGYVLGVWLNPKLRS